MIRVPRNNSRFADWARDPIRIGEIGPDGMQRLLRRADWDIDGVRDDVRNYAAQRLVKQTNSGKPGEHQVGCPRAASQDDLACRSGCPTRSNPCRGGSSAWMAAGSLFYNGVRPG